MSHLKRSMNIVIGMLVVAVGMAPMSFVAPASQSTNDPQAGTDSTNPPSSDGFRFDDDSIQVGYITELKIGEANLDHDFKTVVHIDATDPDFDDFESFRELSPGNVPDQEGPDSDTSSGQNEQDNSTVQLVEDYLRRFIKRSQPRDAGFRKFKEVTGFNPETDATSITYVLTGDCTTQGGDIIAGFRGPFNSSEIEGHLDEDDQFESDQENGQTTFTMAGGYKVITHDDNTLMMSTSKKEVSRLLLKQLSRSFSPAQATGDSSEMYETSSSISIAMKVQKKTQAKLQERTATNVLSHVKGAGLSLGFTNESLILTLVYLVDTPANAAAIEEKIRGLAKPNDERTREDRILAIALSNLLKIWNHNIRLSECLTCFMRMGQAILNGELLQLSKIEDGTALTNGGPDAGRIRKVVFTPNPGITLPDLLEHLTGISMGLKE